MTMQSNYRGQNDYFTRKGTVSYANHKLEFLTFFENHKKICDEISGLRQVENPIDKHKNTTISRVNFRLALNRVNAFIIQYLYAVEEKAKADAVLKRFYELESRFNDDKKYKEFIKKSNDDDINKSSSLEFNKLYVDYLIECFEIVYVMSQYLQKSLNITTIDFAKTLAYLDYEGFYNNLNVYREEVANDLGSLNFVNLLGHYKKILGYFFTYRYLLTKDSQSQISYLLEQIYSVITSSKHLDLVLKFSDGEVNSSDKVQVVEELQVFRNWFNWIYIKCNKDFSNKSILPKSKNTVKLDNSLI